MGSIIGEFLTSEVTGLFMNVLLEARKKKAKIMSNLF